MPSPINRNLNRIFADIHSDNFFQKHIVARYHAIPTIAIEVAFSALGVFFSAVAGASTVAKLPFQAAQLIFKNNATLHHINQKMWGLKDFVDFAVNTVLLAIGALSTFGFGLIVHPAWNIKAHQKLGLISDKKITKWLDNLAKQIKKDLSKGKEVLKKPKTNKPKASIHDIREHRDHTGEAREKVS